MLDSSGLYITNPDIEHVMKVYAETDKVVWDMAILSFLLLIACSILTVFLAAKITRPYELLETFSKTLSNGDLTGSCPDFVSREAAMIRRTVDSVRGIEAKIARLNAQITEQVAQISLASAAIEEMSANIKSIDVNAVSVARRIKRAR